ncbi:MAG TPA: hypothetical protein VKE25_01345 [Actinomycetes bacterium]|nr:hypothetical protein [Actinomycetes bacterium]
MNQAREDVIARACVALAGMAGAVLAILLPSQLMATTDASGTITLALLALVLAALVRFGVRYVALAARTYTALPSTVDDARPILSGRVTDPVHDPLRPRAPGLA